MIDGEQVAEQAVGVLLSGLEAQGGADAGQKLHAAERLGQVVIGAQVESPDLYRLFDVRGKHDDRRSAPFA